MIAPSRPRAVAAPLLLAAALLLPACAGPEIATRNAPSLPEAAGWQVSEIRVRVPEHLSVSEENSYFPDADIVWRCSPRGDRHEQVAHLLENALRQGSAHLEGPLPVLIEAEVVRWHGVTQRTRYTFGGVHDIGFELTVRDAASGVPLAEALPVHTRLRALSGERAIAADAAGDSQTARVTRHLSALVAWHLGADAAPLPRPAAPGACTGP